MASLFIPLHQTKSLYLLALTLVLMPFNWGLESLKWKMSLNTIYPLPFEKAFRSVLIGLVLGILSPGRLAAFAGKVILLPKEYRASGSLLHFVNGAFQLSITVLFGIIGLIYIGGFFNNALYLLAVALIALFLFAFLMLKFDMVFNFIRKNRLLKRFRFVAIDLKFSLTKRLLFLSFLRYIIFSLQYFLVLKVFKCNGTEVDLFARIAVAFLITSFIPMFLIVEPGIKAGISVLLFSSFQPESVFLVSASFVLWFINMIIPSIIGYVLFTKVPNRQFLFQPGS